MYIRFMTCSSCLTSPSFLSNLHIAKWCFESIRMSSFSTLIVAESFDTSYFYLVQAKELKKLKTCLRVQPWGLQSLVKAHIFDVSQEPEFLRKLEEVIAAAMYCLYDLGWSFNALRCLWFGVLHNGLHESFPLLRIDAIVWRAEEDLCSKC